MLSAHAAHLAATLGVIAENDGDDEGDDDDDSRDCSVSG